MTDTDTPGQPDHGRLLGKFTPRYAVRLTLHERDNEVLLLRHRFNTYAGNEAGIAAHVTTLDDEPPRILWDSWHREHQPEWMKDTEEWIRETLTQSSTDRGR